MEKQKYCKCGCGRLVKPGRLYAARGHTWRGRKHSKESIKKISKAKKGASAWNKGKIGIYTKATIKRMSLGHKRHPTRYWLGKKFPKEFRRKLSLLRQGENAPMYGKKHSIATKKRMRKVKLGHKVSKSAKHKISIKLIGRIIPREIVERIRKKNKGQKRTKKFGLAVRKRFKGKKLSKEHVLKLSLSHIGKQTGADNPLWRGGKSFEPYTPEFTHRLRINIRKRDNYACQECGIKQKKIWRELDIHHIDYDKHNNSPKNLISLCFNCHLKTTSSKNRDYWTKHFKEKMLRRGHLELAL